MIIVFINIVSSLVAALLFTIGLQLFERIAHYIEYASQITGASWLDARSVVLICIAHATLPHACAVTLADFIFIFNSPNGTIDCSASVVFQLLFASTLVVASVLKVLFYTGTITVAMGNERSSHFFEFTGEMANSAWAFFFALTRFAELSATQKDHDTRLKND